MMKTLVRTSHKLQQNTNKMEETIMAKSQKVTYQWIKGDRLHDVVTVAEDQKDGKWLYFDDGTRINPSLINEFLMRVSNPTEILKPVTPQQQVQDVTQTVEPVTEAPVQKETPSNEVSIMGKMIMKMSKKNVVNVPLQMNISIPTPQLHSMLLEGMEEADLNEEIMAIVLQQIEIDNLTEYLKENISLFLSDYYSDN